VNKICSTALPDSLNETCRSTFKSSTMAFTPSAALATIATFCIGLSTLVAPAAAVTDVDVLNFALQLEYLEATFYSFAAFGYGIDVNLLGGGPKPVGGRKGNLSGPTLNYAKEVTQDEINHVKFLRSALGSAAVPIPEINIGTAFQAAANAALKTTLNPKFDPYANNIFFIHGAFIFEDVGVTAYQGAAPLIKNKDFLAAAAGILAVEAYHASLVRTLLFQISETIVLPYNVKVKVIVQAISDLRGSVGGGKDQGIVDDKGMANIVPTDDNSITFARTPAEVLAIVTLGSANNRGGFFPKGLNGNIK